MAVVWKKLAYEADVVLEGDFGANSILAADTIDTPASLEIAEQRLVGRITAGNIVGLTAAQVLTLIGVTSGADVTGENAPQAHAASHKNAGSDEILLHEFGEPTSAVDFDLQQATDLVVFTVANEAARDALAAAATEVGQLCFATGELTLAVCTASSV